MRNFHILFLTSMLFIGISNKGSAQSTNISGPAGSGYFGNNVTILTNGNYVVTDPLFDDGAIVNVGAVYLYNGNTHTLISTLKGSSENDQVGNGGIFPLSNGNYVVNSYNWHNGAISNSGASTWCNGSTGISGIVSINNSLVGSTENDFVGQFNPTELSNGNYLVISYQWNNNAGAITWVNGSSGISGVLNSTNSLVGSKPNDNVGGTSVTFLNNGNYIVNSPQWDNGTIVNAGAVTWCNGNTGLTGEISSSNSLVGSSLNDYLGSGYITALSNGNYVVNSSYWNNGAVLAAGAVTWGNGTIGTTGVVSSSNSLVGSKANDGVGNNGITALKNGNYIVSSKFWDNGSIVDAGAATWGNGTTGISGVLSSINSLVGSATNDNVGIGGITELTNGNYVINSYNWQNGTIFNAGAVTWGNGSTGISGTINSTNSLTGGSVLDRVGINGIFTLNNGNYLVLSTNWRNGGLSNVGAVTWGNGNTGISGVISSSNSLVGNKAEDKIGSEGITELTNGNYTIRSPNWDNGTILNAGAVTWGNGSTGISGVVSSSNSLVGSTINDNIGENTVIILNNGNYVVIAPKWDNGANSNAGAATWCNGLTGLSGEINSSNSLVGSSANDQVGSGLYALSNGNYVVGSPNWNNGVITFAGAATWGNGSTGISGIINSNNSLVGSKVNDAVGYWGITVLNNGNYVVNSPFWNNGNESMAGAVTWGNANSGITGFINSSNSLVGSKANDFVGSSGIIAMSNGNYLVSSYEWNNNSVIQAGAVTWGNGIIGISGEVNNINSVVGSANYDNVGSNLFILNNGNYAVSSYQWDNGSIINAGAITPVNVSTGVTGFITPCNSVLGASANSGYTLEPSYNSVYDYLIVSRPEENIITVFIPSAVELANSLDNINVNIGGNTSVPLIASGGCRIIATLKPNGGNAVNGIVDAKVWIEPTVPTYSGKPYVARHYEISPAANPSTATGRLTLYFTQQEFDDFNNHPVSTLKLPVNGADVIGKANLKIGTYPGISNNGSGLPGTYLPGESVIDPVDTDIIWNATQSRWEVSFDVTGFSGFIIQTSSVALPLTLLEFNGRLQNDNAILNWKTTNEQNTKSFDVERSVDGINYSFIGNVSAANVSGIHNYELPDHNVLTLRVPVIYYRLKQIDMDNRFAYSRIIALSVENKNMVLLYPNPAINELNLAVTISKGEQAQIKIMDNLGRVVKQHQINLSSGSNSLSIDLNGLSKGTYYLELKGEVINESKSFIKQ